MRERLIELLLADVECSKDGHGDCSMCEYNSAENECVKYLATLLADNLLANGVIVPPCKVGDSCYPLPRYKTPIVERKISRIAFSKRNIIIGYYENDGQYRPPLRTRILGDDVFLTREDAERALKGEHHG